MYSLHLLPSSRNFKGARYFLFARWTALEFLSLLLLHCSDIPRPCAMHRRQSKRSRHSSTYSSHLHWFFSMRYINNELNNSFNARYSLRLCTSSFCITISILCSSLTLTLFDRINICNHILCFIWIFRFYTFMYVSNMELNENCPLCHSVEISSFKRRHFVCLH